MAHKGMSFSDMALTLLPYSLSHRERAGVRGLRRYPHPSLTLTLSQRERGRKAYPRSQGLDGGAMQPWVY